MDKVGDSHSFLFKLDQFFYLRKKSCLRYEIIDVGITNVSTSNAKQSKSLQLDQFLFINVGLKIHPASSKDFSSIV